MKVRVYGYSDDLIEIEKEQNGRWIPFDEIGCYDADVRIVFQDDTEILCGYPKRTGAIWFIRILQTGTSDHSHTACNNEDDEIYSDVFVIELSDDKPIIKKVSKRERL